MYLLIHTSLPPAALTQPIKELLAAVAPKFTVNRVHTMHVQMSDLLRHKQTTMALLLAFGGIALALAIVGVYAVMSYAVGQRVAECGVRLALGALPQDLSWLILKDGLKLLAVGLAIGLGLAVLFGYYLSSQLFDVAPFDPVTLIGSAVVLCIITLAACLPAGTAGGKARSSDCDDGAMNSERETSRSVGAAECLKTVRSRQYPGRRLRCITARIKI